MICHCQQFFSFHSCCTSAFNNPITLTGYLKKVTSKRYGEITMQAYKFVKYEKIFLAHYMNVKDKHKF